MKINFRFISFQLPFLGLYIYKNENELRDATLIFNSKKINMISAFGVNYFHVLIDLSTCHIMP